MTRNSLITLTLGAAAVGMLLLGNQSSLSATPGLDAQDQVEDLVVCYANGTDTIGLAVNATGAQPLDSMVNLGDPQFAAGLAYYQQCFTDDFKFILQQNGVTVLTVPNPANPLPHAAPALQWANFVNNAFRGPQYINTQHHMGSIKSEVNGNNAVANSYLIATHRFGPNSPISPITGVRRTGVSVVGGNYTDEDVRINGEWRIKTRTLNITSSVSIPAGLQ